MTKFLLGVAVGYVFSDMIDELITRIPDTMKDSEPTTPSPMPPPTSTTTASEETL
jgi:hypothetical protein